MVLYEREYCSAPVDFNKPSDTVKTIYVPMPSSYNILLYYYSILQIPVVLGDIYPNIGALNRTGSISLNSDKNFLIFNH